MTIIYLLCKGREDSGDEVLAWSNDKDILEREATRLEWAGYYASLAESSEEIAAGRLKILSPDATDYRDFWVLEVAEFEPRPPFALNAVESKSSPECSGPSPDGRRRYQGLENFCSHCGKIGLGSW
jgi:hypothetical protein